MVKRGNAIGGYSRVNLSWGGILAVPRGRLKPLKVSDVTGRFQV